LPACTPKWPAGFGYCYGAGLSPGIARIEQYGNLDSSYFNLIEFGGIGDLNCVDPALPIIWVIRPRVIGLNPDRGIVLGFAKCLIVSMGCGQGFPIFAAIHRER